MTDIVERLKESEIATHALFNYILRDAREEIERLRAKVEQMEKQAPVAWAATDETCRIVEALSFNQSRRFDTPLFTLPGAQPTPSVPDDGVLKDAERYRFLEHLCATGTYGGIISRKDVDAAMLAAAPETRP